MSTDDTLHPDDDELVVERRGGDRRQGTDRRKQNIPVAVERRSGQDRRQGERRRQVDPTTCERDYTPEEIEFMRAMDQYKRANRRPFPTWSEVLEVLHALGYRKVAEPTALPGLQPIPASENGEAR
jgi:FMN phosphatase YigB (HAD superfamily)